MATLPSNCAPCAELALMSLVKSPKARSSIPNIPSETILILPPVPEKALAVISLLPSGKAAIKVESMLMLPPLPGISSKAASAAICPPSLKTSKLLSRLISPPSPPAEIAVKFPPFSSRMVSALISSVPAFPTPSTGSKTRTVLVIILPDGVV
jgi:hypothetical protein